MSMQDFTIDDARHMLAWQYEMGADEALLDWPAESFFIGRPVIVQPIDRKMALTVKPLRCPRRILYRTRRQRQQRHFMNGRCSIGFIPFYAFGWFA